MGYKKQIINQIKQKCEIFHLYYSSQITPKISNLLIKVHVLHNVQCKTTNRICEATKNRKPHKVNYLLTNGKSILTRILTSIHTPGE